LKPECQKTPLDRIAEARLALQFIKTTEQLKDLDARLEAARSAYLAASHEQCLEGAITEEDAAEQLEEARQLTFESNQVSPQPIVLDEETLRVQTAMRGCSRSQPA
jgi:hypothetical protein